SWAERLRRRLFAPVALRRPIHVTVVAMVALIAVYLYQRTPELQVPARPAPALQTSRDLKSAEEGPASAPEPSPAGRAAPASPPASAAPPAKEGPAADMRNKTGALAKGADAARKAADAGWAPAAAPPACGGGEGPGPPAGGRQRAGRSRPVAVGAGQPESARSIAAGRRPPDGRRATARGCEDGSHALRAARPPGRVGRRAGAAGGGRPEGGRAEDAERG